MTQYEIEDCFRKKTPSDVEAVLKIVDLLVNKDAANNKILALYNLLGQELFVKVCLLLDGDKLDLPNAEQMTQNMTFAICYLEKFAHGMDWNSIKKKYPSLEISSLKFSSMAQSLEDYMRKILQEEARKVTNSEKDAEHGKEE
jgi:hypothetical protein